jgi:hypothetical protein
MKSGHSLPVSLIQVKPAEVAMSRNLFVISVLGLLLCFAIILMHLDASAASTINLPSAGPDCFEEGLPCGASRISIASAPALPNSAGTQYRTYAGNQFKSTSSNLTYQSYGPAIRALVIPSGGFSFIHELDLPQGAQLTEVDFYYVDNADTNFSFELISANPSTGAWPTLVSSSSSGASSAIQAKVSTGTPIATIDNAAKSYFMRVVFGEASANLLLYGARIGFTTYGTYLPIVMKTSR